MDFFDEREPTEPLTQFIHTNKNVAKDDSGGLWQFGERIFGWTSTVHVAWDDQADASWLHMFWSFEASKDVRPAPVI